MAGLLDFLQSLTKYKGAVGLAGLIVLSALLVLLQILRLEIFAPVDAAGTLGLLSLIVRSVFWLAIVAVVVSGLAYILPARFFVPTSRLEYAVAVFRMFDPASDGIGAINDRYEPYVGFPYYSRESDHPSYWPARVHHDRGALAKQYESFFGRADVQAALTAARARAGDGSSVQVYSSAPGGPDSLAAVVTTARMFFNFHLDGDKAALSEAIGENLAREFLAIEDARNNLRPYHPNRIAILRLRNVGPRTIHDVTVEYEVAGLVYDTKIRTVAEGSKEESLPFEHRLVIPKILVGQTYDVTIWYWYLPVNKRSFPDKINFIQELTQGFTVSNFAVATGGKVVFKPELLKDVPAYERLYDGDARKRDNPERELAELFALRAAESAEAIKHHNERHLTAQDLTLDSLVAFPAEESQVENVWLEFVSPAGKHYRAVCVYDHPDGPYVLLSSESKDKSDFAAVRAALAEAINGDAESEISDRSNDICSSVAVVGGFTRETIRDAFRALENAGFREVVVKKLHYQKSAA